MQGNHGGRWYANISETHHHHTRTCAGYFSFHSSHVTSRPGWSDIPVHLTINLLCWLSAQITPSHLWLKFFPQNHRELDVLELPRPLLQGRHHGWPPTPRQ